MDKDNKLFPKMELAVKALALCCPDKKENCGKLECDGNNKSPIARSEVFNETWMLRLTLALIHDYEGKFSLSGDKKIALDRIRVAVQKRWISEGGLEAAFKNEGTTWTDAILGDVRLRGESANYDEKAETDGNKRKVELAGTTGKNAGVVIVEAKMGSLLDKSVTNSKDYDQVARSIACLAKLLLKNNNDAAYLENSAVVVFMPDPERCLDLLPELDDDQKERMRKALEKRMVVAKEFFDKAKKTIKIQTEDNRKDAKGNSIKPRVYDIVKEKLEEFDDNVEKIAQKSMSMILTWDEIIDAITDESENKKELRFFYIKALKEIIPKKRKCPKRK